MSWPRLVLEARGYAKQEGSPWSDGELAIISGATVVWFHIGDQMVEIPSTEIGKLVRFLWDQHQHAREFEEISAKLDRIIQLSSDS